MGFSFDHLAKDVTSDLSDIGHDVQNAGRVAETLFKGAYEYTVHNPASVAEDVGIAVLTGAAVGAAVVLFPESALLATGLTVGGGIMGVVGLGAIGEESYEAFKKAWPDLEIVWNADDHSHEEVAKAETAVQDDTGSAMTNLILIPVATVAGTYAGNVGAEAAVALSADPEEAAAALASSNAAQSSQNALEKLAGSQENYYLGKSDVQAFARGIGRFLPSAGTAAKIARVSAHASGPA